MLNFFVIFLGGWEAGGGEGAEFQYLLYQKMEKNVKSGGNVTDNHNMTVKTQITSQFDPN